MEPFALSGLLAGVSSIIFGFLVLFKSPNRQAGRIWFLFSISVAGWGFGDFIIPHINDPSLALAFWKATLAFGANWIAVLFFHFVLVFLNQKKNVQLLIHYIICVFFFIVSPSSLIYSGVSKPVGNFYYCVAGPLYLVHSFWWLSLVLYSHFCLLKTYKFLTPRNQMQIKYFFLATVVGFSGGSFSFLPPLGLPIYPWGNFSIFLYPLIMSYSIIQHRLMDINLVFRYAAIRFLLCLCFAGPIAMLVFLTQSIYFACVMILFSAFVWPIVDRFTKVFTDTVDRLPPFRGRYDHLTKVTDHIQRLNGATEIKEWAQILADSIKSLLKIRRVNILVWNSEKKYFMNRGGVGLTPADTVFLSLPPDSSISLNLSRNRKMLIRDLVSIEYQPKEAEKLLNEFDFLSSDISVPLFVGNDLRAFINICLDVKGQLLNDLEIGSLLHIATGASISLHSILATQSYEESKLEWAHDLRHPFGPKGGLQHINELLTFASNNLPNNLLKKLESIRDDIWYVGKHLEKILQSGGGEETLNIQTTSLIGTFERIRDDYQLYAKEKKIEWVVDIPDKQVSVRCDEESIKYRVLPNFLNNAFRITPNGGRIELGYRLNQESFVGFIKDNGPGMKKNIMISIFERGVQGDNSTRGSKGIGLYNVRKVIEAQGGKVWVESEPGKGSCFYFSLPIEKHGARSSAI